MSLGVAIIGSGIFVREKHLPAVQSCPNLTLRAIYSRSSKSASALSANVPIYSDDSGSGNTYHDLLLRSDIHCVIIALPIPTQPEFIEAALAAGKHVLSEKPVAADIKRAERLIEYSASEKVKNGAKWAVAENFRYLESLEKGREEVERMGRVLGFQVKVWNNVKAGTKYVETPWRKKPEYQGGFLLDGGVHFVAGTRLLLGSDYPTMVTASTTLLQQHLPPVDTVNSVWQTKSGISGTFSASFATTLKGTEYTVACEKGSVTVLWDKVIVREGEESEGNVKEYDFKGAPGQSDTGVAEEVKAWAEGIISGKPDPRQSPEAALADLEILEAMLKSGEANGQPQTLKYQG